VLVLRRERLSIPEQGPHDPLPPIEDADLDPETAKYFEGDVAYVWRCSKCGLMVDVESPEQARRMADVHEEFVHRLGLFIEAPVEPDTD
jgi:hypothetical protein